MILLYTSEIYSIMHGMETVCDHARDQLRPGDRREPLLVRLSAAQRALFVREYQAARAAPIRAYALLLERRLLLDDLGDLEASGLELAAALDDAAREVRAGLALVGASSTYLRSFSRTTTSAPVAGALLVPVPIRLYARATRLTPETTIEPGAVAQSIAWERASVATGRTMAEWGLATALAVYVGATHPDHDGLAGQAERYR